MLLYIVIVYDENGDPYVVSEHKELVDAYESAGDSRGTIYSLKLDKSFEFYDENGDPKEDTHKENTNENH